MNELFNAIEDKDITTPDGRFWMEMRDDRRRVTAGNKCAVLVMSRPEAQELYDWLGQALYNGAKP